MKFTNLLNSSAWLFLILTVLLLIPTLGGSVRLLVPTAVFCFAHLLTKEKTKKTKTLIGTGIYAFFIILTLYLTRTVIINLDGSPERVNILTNVKEEPEIHSHFVWRKHIEADSTFIIRTSSPGSLLKNIKFDINDISGKNIGGRGTIKTYGTCGNNSLIISLQTIYVDFNAWPDSAENAAFQALREEQHKICESVN
ncbi:MAG: hypothetical protein NXI08_11050 [bacterium]|nr:hypothetical protein [bacterium]